jgi:hypothetical protein
MIFKNFGNTNSYSSTLFLIVEWMNKYKNIITNKPAIIDFLDRVRDPTEEIQDIVDDFLYSDKYRELRNEFSRK